MIESELIITSNCDECEKKIDLEDEVCLIFHEECLNKNHLSNMKDIMKDILDEKEWETYDGVGLKNDEDKKNFMNGIKYGIKHALFWYADKLGGSDGVILFEEIGGHDK